MKLLGELRKALVGPSARPLYARLASACEASIRDGTLRVGESLPSERELVAGLGVSRKTVRAALAALVARKLVVSTQGRGNFVRDEVPGRPLRILVPERFRPDHWGGPAMHYDWIHRAESACRCKVHYLYTPTEEQMLASLMDREHGFDAALVFRPPHSWVAAIRREKRRLLGSTALPLLVVNRDLGRAGIPFVTSDHRGGAARAVAHLAGLGHRRVLLLLSSRDPSVAADLAAGYRDGLVAAGIPRAVAHLLYVNDPAKSAVAAALVAALRRRPFTALVAGGSILTSSLPEALETLGRAVPGNLSVVALAEPEYLKRMRRDWTAVVQQNQVVATTAMRRLCELARGLCPETVAQRIPPRFHRGTTCASLREETPPT